LVLEQLQRFEPPEIFGRDLREYLALQLQDRGRLTPEMAALLDNLELAARGDATKLTGIYSIDSEELSKLIFELRTLNPKPGEADNTIVAQAVAPDVLMRWHPDGSWIIELNPETLPRVLVNSQYYQKFSREIRKRQDKDYIAERFQTANWLVKSLHQRATTILKVARKFVRQQDAFFTSDAEHLRPLILRDIAEEIEMHESTVSRVTSNKYIATPRGTFELKYF
jgi:RNA polymerase sigma-54 factor